MHQDKGAQKRERNTDRGEDCIPESDKKIERQYNQAKAIEGVILNPLNNSANQYGGVIDIGCLNRKGTSPYLFLHN
jgi:hypothetical protein